MCGDWATVDLGELGLDIHLPYMDTVYLGLSLALPIRAGKVCNEVNNVGSYSRVAVPYWEG